VEPERGDVVAGVGDDRELVVAERIEQPARELRATRAAGQQDDHGRPVMRMPECLIL
jgi:hypothetical protein